MWPGTIVEGSVEPVQDRPQRVQGGQSRGHPVRFARVQADLHRGGAAHHQPAPRAGSVEELLHRRVPGHLEHPVRGPQRVEALPGQAQASGKHCLAEGGQIAAGDVHAGGEALRWRGTDLHLPAGLRGKTAATRERASATG